MGEAVSEALALAKCPKPCSECPDGSHHWIEDWSGATEVDPDNVTLACKHCDATAGLCFDCSGPIVPIVDDSGLCQDCKGTDGDEP